MIENDDQEATQYSCPESERLSQLSYFHDVPDEAGIFHFTEDQCHKLTREVCRASCNYPFLFNWHYELLRDIGSDLGLSEVSKVNQKETDSQIIVETVTTKGFLASEDRTTAIWHFSLPDKALPKGLISLIDHSQPISHTYEGERYYLVPTLSRCGSKKSYIPSLDGLTGSMRCSQEGHRWNPSVLNAWTI
jgi:hypothetical protein